MFSIEIEHECLSLNSFPYRSIAVQTMTSLTGVNVIQYYQSKHLPTPPTFKLTG